MINKNVSVLKRDNCWQICKNVECPVVSEQDVLVDTDFDKKVLNKIMMEIIWRKSDIWPRQDTDWWQ